MLLSDANELLRGNAERDDEVVYRLNNSYRGRDLDIFIDDENVFTLAQIKKVCTRYRLRFLDTIHFKSDYPYNAIAEINAFEKKYNTKISSFRIIAPSKAFDLENINQDPLLFAQLSDNRFYLLHQWGKDLAWYRKILTWPLQSFKTLIISLLLMCTVFAFSIPSSVMHIFNFESEMYLRIWLTLHTFIGMLGLTLWAGLAFDKTFSGMSWNSKYYNY